MALGPQGIGLLSEPALAALDPAVSVALAALGVFVGLDLKFRRPREDRLLAAASLEAGTTILVVAGGVLLVHALSPSPSLTNPWLFAVLLGLCASSSSTPAEASPEARQSAAMRLGDLDDVLPIVLGALALAWAREGTAGASAWVFTQAVVIALMIALAARLLVAQTSSDSEQRVFAIGALLLLGGTAAHLSLSALFVGFLAGVFWNAAGPPALDALARDMRYLQHPLTVLLLVVAGARVTFAAGVAGLVVAYVVLRTAAKLLGGWFAASAVAPELPREVGFHLTSPGIVGLAFALNTLQARGDLGFTSTVFTIVVAGSLASDALSLLALRREGPR
jgi:hypothetical protein